MDIKDLSISDLKSAYDFTLIDLAELKGKAKRENISPNKIPAYGEVKSLEARLYDELLNRTRMFIKK